MTKPKCRHPRLFLDRNMSEVTCVDCGQRWRFKKSPHLLEVSGDGDCFTTD